MDCEFSHKVAELHAMIKIKIPKRKRNFRKKKSEINPNIYWNYLLYLTFFLIVASFAFGTYAFLWVNKGPGDSAAEPAYKNAVGKDRMDQVLDIFSKRNIRSMEITNSPAPVVDPSL